MTKAFLLGFIAGASKTATWRDNPFSEVSYAYAEWSKGFFCGEDNLNPMQDILKLGE